MSQCFTQVNRDAARCACLRWRKPEARLSSGSTCSSRFIRPPHTAKRGLSFPPSPSVALARARRPASLATPSPCESRPRVSTRKDTPCAIVDYRSCDGRSAGRRWSPSRRGFAVLGRSTANASPPKPIGRAEEQALRIAARRRARRRAPRRKKRCSKPRNRPTSSRSRPTGSRASSRRKSPRSSRRWPTRRAALAERLTSTDRLEKDLRGRERATRASARARARPQPRRVTSSSSPTSSASCSASPASRPTRPRSCCCARSRATPAATPPTWSSGSRPKRARPPAARAQADHHRSHPAQRRRARHRDDRLGGRSAERRPEGPHHRPRGPQHPRARARHRRRADRRRHAGRDHPLELRPLPPRGRAPGDRAADRRRPHPSGAHRGGRRKGQGGDGGSVPQGRRGRGLRARAVRHASRTSTG